VEPLLTDPIGQIVDVIEPRLRIEGDSGADGNVTIVTSGSSLLVKG